MPNPSPPAPEPPRRAASMRRRLARVAVGRAISAVALVIVAREASLTDIAEALDDVRWPWLLALAAARAAIVLIKGIRWHVILGPVAPDSRRGAVGAVAVGYLANLVLPIRVGEILRVALLRRRN